MTERTELGSELYVLFDDDIARMKLEFFPRRVFVHYHAKASAFKVARRALRIWPQVMAICKRIGYARIEALFKDDKALERLCRLCGFTTVGHERGLTYMRCNYA